MLAAAPAAGGWLTREGTPDSEPLTVADISLKLRRPPGEIQRTLEFLSCPEAGVNWLIVHPPTIVPDGASTLPPQCPGGAQTLPAQCLNGTTELNCTELHPLAPDDSTLSVKNGHKAKGLSLNPAITNGVTGEVKGLPPSDPSMDSQPTLFGVPTPTPGSPKKPRPTTKKVPQRPPESVEELIAHCQADERFTKLDVPAQFELMVRWLEGHPDRQMSQGFALNWLKRALTDVPIHKGTAATHSVPVDPDEALEAMRAIPPRRRTSS